MKFKPTHTAEFMLQQAQNEADGYFEVTLNGTKDRPTTRNHVSVTVRDPGPGKHHAGRRIIWRRANVEVTRRAINDTLDAWRAM